MIKQKGLLRGPKIIIDENGNRKYGNIWEDE